MKLEDAEHLKGKPGMFMGSRADTHIRCIEISELQGNWILRSFTDKLQVYCTKVPISEPLTSLSRRVNGLNSFPLWKDYCIHRAYFLFYI